MPTRLMFRDDAYLAEAEAVVERITDEGAVVLDQSVFYPSAGGQPGDSGWLEWGEGRVAIATALKVPEGEVALVPLDAVALPRPGQRLRQSLDWERRHRHMRLHTALHLLSVVIPLPVTGGQIGSERARLDFDMPDPPGPLDEIEAAVNALIERDLPVGEMWIDAAELDARPELVKTLSVRPPRGDGQVRLVRIGEAAAPVDLQPCGGTHVARTGEIGRIRMEKAEKKGRINRRITLALLPP